MNLEIVGGRLRRFSALGFSINRTKDAVGAMTAADFTGSTGGGWNYLFRHVREAFTGAWQRNHVESNPENILSYPTVYACATLIAGDIGKVRPKLVKRDADGIWEETDSPAFSPVLRKPNHYQTRIQFFIWWLISKLIHGNTYVLKARDASHKVKRLYILDPCRVKPLVAPDGSVFYELTEDKLSGLTPRDEPLRVPASEIIHDVMIPLFHPLCGVSPLFAAAVAALHALNIQHTSSRFFQNGQKPGGVLTAPGNISQATADRVTQYWETQFSGDNIGKIAVLGDGLKYEPMAVNAHDAQLIAQLDWDDKKICSVFHVPPYMVGVGDMPNYDNIEALNQQYYSQCLQVLFESIEILLDEGLELGKNEEGKQLGTEFDLDDLLKMDTATLIESEKNAAGIKAPNESRKRLGLKPVKGGETPYLQQQNFSLAALDARDRANPAPSTTTTTHAPTPDPKPTEPTKTLSEDATVTRYLVMKRARQAAERYAA